MRITDSFILGAIQGLTEFLPISSSGHLVLVETWLKLNVENLKSFDIAVHVGTLLAIIVYFRRDIGNLWKAFLLFIFERKISHSKEISRNQKTIIYLIFATLPAIIVTLSLEKWIDEHFRNPQSVAIMIMSIGILFFLVEWIASHRKQREIGFLQSFLIGLAQTLALIPGVSRSGITISAGLLQGVKREDAAKFSFLLGGVAILSGAFYAILGILKGKYAAPELEIALTGTLTSFLFGLGAISFLMHYLKNHTLKIFGIYRVLLGVSILFFL